MPSIPRTPSFVFLHPVEHAARQRDRVTASLFGVSDESVAYSPLTLDDLADKPGLHRTYLSDIERGWRNVSLINIERLAAALSLALSELFQRVEQA